jgi:TonB family protein
VTFEVLKSAPKDIRKSNAVVRQVPADPTQLTENSSDPQAFNSEKTQRVKKQTKAAESGLTANRMNKSASSQGSKNSSDDVTRTKKQNSKPVVQGEGIEKFLPRKIKFDDLAKDSDEKHAKGSESNISSRDLMNQGVSTLSEVLPDDVKIGEITSLNTDAYVYYSFVSRTQEQLWNEWSPRVQWLFDHPTQEMLSSARGEFVTYIEIWLHPNGDLHSTHILKPSGVPQLDQIAENSFRHMAVFPHPPKEKIESDGLIRFQWGLMVKYDPKVWFAQKRAQ